MLDGDEMVLNGRKWWSTGPATPLQGRHLDGPPDADETATSSTRWCSSARHARRQDRAHAAGLRLLDAPSWARRAAFNNVRLPAERHLGGPGNAFEIAQGRLGPGGSTTACAIGAAEWRWSSLDDAPPTDAFGKPLANLGGNRERIADARIAIDQARLHALHAAWKIDQAGALRRDRRGLAIKVAVPNMLQEVVDAAIQMHGGAGLSDDMPLTGFLTGARACGWPTAPTRCTAA